MKKIIILTHGAHGGYGGIDKYVKNIINVLSKNKNKFQINIFSKKKIFLNKKNVFIEFSEKFHSLIIIKNLINIFKSDLIIVTHINLTLYLFFLIFNKKKIVLFSYGLDIWGNKKNFLYKIFIKKIRYFISMRRYTMSKQKSIFQIKPRKEFLLHNSFDEANYNPRKKIGKRKKIVTSVARLSAAENYVGIDETLEAMALIKKIEFKYIIIGDGDDKERLIRKANKLKIKKHVIFKGYLNDKARDNVLKSSKVFSMPGSRLGFDTYPYRFAFLEAASQGQHILASNPTKDELIEAKKYKCFNFVNPNDRKSLSNKIIKLLNKKNCFCKNLNEELSFKNFDLRLTDYIKNIMRD